MNGTTPVVANITVKGLTIRYYVQVGFALGADPAEGESAGVSQKCTTLVDNTLTNIGSTYGDCVTPSSGPHAGALVVNRPECVTGPTDNYGCTCVGFGAIDLVHSGSNSLKDNKVIKAENLPGKAHLIHAFYIAHKSSNNLIENNYVRQISGTPFKFRDASNNNAVLNNYVERAGTSAFFEDVRGGGEVVSVNNHLEGNLATFSYDGGHNNLTAASVDPDNPPNPNPRFTFGTGQQSGQYYQGDTPTDEIPTASVSADVDGDGKEEVFVALHYPDLSFSKVIYSAGGSNELSEVAYSNTSWRISALAAGAFGGAPTNVVAAFWNGGTQTQIHRGQVMNDGTYRFGAGTLLNSIGSSFWKVTAMAAGQVSGAAQPQLFTAVTRNGTTEVYRGDGISLPSGGFSRGVNEGGSPLYSSANWTISAMTTGRVNDSGVRLVSAFRFGSSGTSRLYLGSGAPSGGVIDLGSFWEHPSIGVTALTTGRFDGIASRLVTGFDNGGVGEVFLASVSGSVINPRAVQLYSNSLWDIATLTRSETNASSSGDELITAFHGQNRNQIWSGDGTTASSGAGNFNEYYRWP
ncbi:MAG TPA: hypothetical protein VJN18_00840 [Polyangiaceae bacterium]|nr:hypothetical protein [Polyangiaceae bacterium]